jgi:predicted metalloenzyme YecM
MAVRAARRQRDGVEVDLHQLELRHRDLRIHDRVQRQRLIRSVAEIGQQVPGLFAASSIIR